MIKIFIDYKCSNFLIIDQLPILTVSLSDDASKGLN